MKPALVGAVAVAIAGWLVLTIVNALSQSEGRGSVFVTALVVLGLLAIAAGAVALRAGRRLVGELKDRSAG